MNLDYSRVPHVRLVNGVCIPLVGLGNTHSGGYHNETVVYAIRQCGYRHLDTARRYGTERLLADSIERSGVPRSEMFLSTKLWPMDFGFDNTLAAFEASCERLRTDYIDVYLIHMPVVPNCLNVKDKRQLMIDTWRAMEKLYDEGRCRAIGVSNYSIADLNDLLSYARVRPMVNQVEFNPYYNEPELLRFCRNNDILMTGYCPLGKARALQEPIIQNIAKRYAKTPAQICIRWSLEHGVPAIPKSTKIHRAAENIQVFDFHLTRIEIAAIDSLRDLSRKTCRLDDIQKKFQLPDGYKMAATTGYIPTELHESQSTKTLIGCLNHDELNVDSPPVLVDVGQTLSMANFKDLHSHNPPKSPRTERLVMNA